MSMMVANCLPSVVHPVVHTTRNTNIPSPPSGYDKIRDLGSGYFGSVMLCQSCDESEEEVAVKCAAWNFPYNNMNAGGNALLNEIKVLSRLSHRTIVSIFGYTYENNCLYLFMEFISEGSIKERKKTEMFSEDRIKSITIDILRGLEYLHQNGIVHRDIKASNILLGIDDEVKISDFGIAVYEREPKDWTGYHTHKAPEVRYPLDYGCRADIWSLGCTVYEMFYGVSPAHEMGMGMGWFRFSLSQRREMSPLCKDFLSCTFNEDPNRRPSASDLLKHRWITTGIYFFHE